MTLLAQNYAMVWGLVFGCLFLGLLAIGIPRVRRKNLPDPNDPKEKAKRNKNKKK